MMKKLIAAILAVVLLAALAVPALAEVDLRYVNTDKVKVYREPNTDSEVLAKYKGGTQLLIEQDLNDWVTILVADTQRGGQMLGYIQTRFLSYHMPQDYCNHEWSKWETIWEATCTEKGKQQRTCAICGKEQSESIKALGHNWSKWKVLEEATCSVKGKRTRSCKTCTYTEIEQYYADHSYGSWITTKEPSCTEQGVREHTCKVCGRTEEKSIEKLPHEYEWKVLVDTTDHSAGKRAKVCVNCGYETGAESFDPEGTLRRKDRGEEVYAMQQLLIEQGYLNNGGADGIFGGGTEKALMQYQQDRGLNPDGIGWPQTIKDLQHDFGPWRTEKEMTRVEDGVRVRVCNGCGFEQREAIVSGEVFEKGRRGEDIRAMQQIMRDLGCNVGSLDGIYGKKLDAALASFAAARDLVVENGRIRPADVDAVVNAWLEQKAEEKWQGEGSVDTPVNLALTVTAANEADDSGIVNYNWSLTNLGSEDVTFTALLLTFGDQPDFRSNNLVMRLDGINLKKNSGNSASGSFSADNDWGEGQLNFAAMAIHDKSDEIWLSNAVSFENSSVPTVKTVMPMREAIDVSSLQDGIYAVSFNPGDVFGGASGIFLNAVQIFDQDVYDIVDVHTLAVGDTLIVGGEEIEVTSVAQEDEFILVNGAEGENAVKLCPLGEDSNGYCAVLENEMNSYTGMGVTTLMLDAAATFTDRAGAEDETVVDYADIVSAIAASADTDFNQYNTTVRIENGKVAEICRALIEAE